jgi:hypothetical protein
MGDCVGGISAGCHLPKPQRVMERPRQHADSAVQHAGSGSGAMGAVEQGKQGEEQHQLVAKGALRIGEGLHITKATGSRQRHRPACAHAC